jgi:hypothetical protein
MAYVLSIDILLAINDGLSAQRAAASYTEEQVSR